jgi:SAM-dependent methyltransferase
VTLFDVIEHAVDDVGLLRQAGRVLRPGGHVVVTVPAGPDLWTRYDDAAGHKRRYDRAMLVTAIEAAGFEVRYAGYFNCLPLVAQTLHRRIASPRADESTEAVAIVKRTLRVPPAPLNAAFGFLMRLEVPLRRLSWVRGGSLIAVARVAP